MKLQTLVPRFLLSVLVAGAVLIAPGADARTKEKAKPDAGTEKKDDKATLQRLPNSTGFESVRNRVSRVDFFSTNYGIFGLNVANTRAGGFWPRGSNQPYIFGGGVWFGAKKFVEGQKIPLSVIGYNPNSGASWMIPGPITGTPEETKLDDAAEGINKNRLYLSTDYNKFTGEPIDVVDDRQGGVNWPVWDTSPTDSLKYSRYFGYYIDDTTQRHRDLMPAGKGPAIISEEDIFSVYNDADVGRYEGQDEKGHPLGIQVEQTIYSWGFDSETSPYRDMIFLRYMIINRSTDTLYECYMAPAMDMDIGDHRNDRAKIAIARKEDDSLNLAVQWSEREVNGRYGYIGFDFLESPAVDSNASSSRFGFVRKDKRVYTEAEQVGLTTFQNWPIDEDPATSTERYDFMAQGQRDPDDAPGDKRFLMATGPFNLAPGDTARVVVGCMFALAEATIPTGTWEDMENLLAIDRFAQKVYDENFLAPAPPEPAQVGWKPLNAGVELSWDETSERSLDAVERGLDFFGYTIQRTRRASPRYAPLSADDTIQGWNLGWKTVAQIPLPPLPDSTARYLAGGTPGSANNPALKRDLRWLGAWWRLPMLADTIPGRPAIIRVDSVYATDTLKRPGEADVLVRGRFLRTQAVFNLAFDPFDDVNDDTLFFDSFLGGKYKDDPRFRHKRIREVVREAIVAIMDSVTNGHRYIDIGDDNGDGKIEESPTDLTLNERLINNIDYYYRVLAYDMGSPDEGTPQKLNGSVFGINEVKATPEAPAAGFPIQPQIVSSNGLGGVHNFRFLVLDDDRLGQLFGGDTIEFEFQPTDLGEFGFIGYYYANVVTARSRRTGDDLFRFAAPFAIEDRLKFSDRQELLDTALRTGYRYFNHRDTLVCDSINDPKDTSATPRRIWHCETKRLKDSIFIEVKNLAVPFNGSYLANPDQPYYGTVGVYKNTFAVAFDYSFLQFSDSLRFGVFNQPGQSPVQLVGQADVNIVPEKQFLGEFAAGTTAGSSIPSIGQVKLEITFEEGGTEDLTVYKSKNLPGGGTELVTLNFPGVRYLNMKVKNIASYNRTVFDENGNEKTETIQYDYTFTPDPDAQVKGDTTRQIDLPRVINQGSYALYAYGWMNVQGLQRFERKRAVTRAGRLVADTTIGTANHYYLGPVTATGHDTTLTFTHRLVINGAEIALDAAGMGTWEKGLDSNKIPATPPQRDFQPGDKVIIDFVGGTLGLPEPGAKVLVAIPNGKPSLEQYTDDLLDQIRVVPNPYLISHIGQRANTERLVYFTRLPEECKIEIYTAAGELMQTLNHKAPTPNGRIAVDAYDLVTKGNRQAQSQLLIARITTPNGAETIKKFAVVVGGFRIVE